MHPVTSIFKNNNIVLNDYLDTHMSYMSLNLKSREKKQEENISPKIPIRLIEIKSHVQKELFSYQQVQ